MGGVDISRTWKGPDFESMGHREAALKFSKETLRVIARESKNVWNKLPRGDAKSMALDIWMKAQDAIKYQAKTIKPLLRLRDLSGLMRKGSAPLSSLTGAAGTTLGAMGAGQSGFDLGKAGMDYAGENMGIPQTMGMYENNMQDIANMQRQNALLQSQVYRPNGGGW